VLAAKRNDGTAAGGIYDTGYTLSGAAVPATVPELVSNRYSLLPVIAIHLKLVILFLGCGFIHKSPWKN
jgi:hypothetical protein